MNKGNWGLKIKDARSIKGLTQLELANKSGLTRNHIARIELGHFKTTDQETFASLARGLGMTLDELNETITGEHLQSQPETTDELWRKLRTTIPEDVPIYEDYPVHAGGGTFPVDYAYLDKGQSKVNKEGYRVHGNCLSPLIDDMDVVIIQRDGQIDIGDIIICLISDEVHIGRLKKIAGELYLENGHGRFRMLECLQAAPVIEVRKRLK